MFRLSESRIVCTLIALVTLGGCSPLGLYNAVIPYDDGSRLAERDIPFGDDPRQKLDVYLPDGDADGPRPVVVFVYGGSWRDGEKSRYTFAGRALAKLGAVVVIADYRLVPQVRFPGFVEDNAAALSWARENAESYGGDPDRIFLAGHSAGAYNAVLLALDERRLRAVDVPPDAIAGVIAISGPYRFKPEEYRVTRAAFEGHFDDPDTQPLNFVDAAAPPMLIVHGEDDTTVYPKNSRALAAALEEAGVPHDLYIYPGIAHAGALLSISQPMRDRAPVYDRIREFLKRPSRR